jgi:cholesterol oxidase
MGEKPTIVVIGSGFGGSVFACRLAERQSATVYVLERGRQYGRNQFPRRPDQLREAFWDPTDGKYGMFEYQSFPSADIDVLTASGLGGGSLIYANVLYEMPPEFFAGWPGGIDRQTIDPYYQKVIDMMEARPYPLDQPTWPYVETPKTQALQRAYERLSSDPLGRPAAQLEWPKLAIRFGREPGKEEPNKHGKRQTNCIMCGECDIGCNVHAKNTLDLNYLARAESCGATVRTGAEVRAILPKADGTGYTVVYADPRSRSELQRLDATYVVVAAGSLGSTKLLLRMKHSGVLPHLSAALGTKWSGNGDLLGFCVKSSEAIYPSTGPVITGAIRFFHGRYPDGAPHGLYIEDAGLPNILVWYFTAVTPARHSLIEGLKGVWRYLRHGGLGGGEVNIGTDISPVFFHESELVSRTMVFLGMGRDRSSGVIRLYPENPTALTPFDDADIHLHWDDGPSQLHFERLRDGMERLTTALGGQYLEARVKNFTKYVAVHPLGGCPMGDSPRNGVVDARTGEVFGHRGLYVIDGSIIPTSIGPNPSLTIAALAEIFAERFAPNPSQS